MVKYDYAFKLTVIKAYLNDEGGYVALARTVAVWVNMYRALGIDILSRLQK